jgi:starch synthase (maltosyl-transferring)
LVYYRNKGRCSFDIAREDLGGEDGLRRVVITHVTPEVDAGRFPVKRTAGEDVTVEADVFLDGHDELACEVQYRSEPSGSWLSARMESLGNDHWRASFHVAEVGRYRYRIEGWPDPFETWRRDLLKRVEAGQDVELELKVGAILISEASVRAAGADRQRLLDRASALEREWDVTLRVSIALEDTLADLMALYPDKSHATLHDTGQQIVVDTERARFGAWYEVFPRSTSPDPTRPGRLTDVVARLPYISSMGFDVLYLPPIHPIGTTDRKGKNNSTISFEDDPGSPWAIGSKLGGHKAIDPGLGTLADFQHLVMAARDHRMEVALDLALQCSPDHPWVKEHPSWFEQRPDGSIRFAENPPKKYQDIYPLNFKSEDWHALWQEVRSVIDYWIEQGVRIFRVDNPHTKPFAFWEWLINGVKSAHPDVIFLSEAFTRPNVMYHLAKLGFTQSYTYFTWRNSRDELVDYFNQIMRPPVSEFFRPNLWPNTPDILHEYLQVGGRPAFITRLVLAATLSASYGIYGPLFELCEDTAREPGSEEYLNSEKYEIKHWSFDDTSSLRPIVTRINQVRRDNPVLQSDRGLSFHNTDNEAIIAFSKNSGTEDIIVTVVNLDPHHVQSGWIELPLADFDLDPHEAFQVHDLLGDERFTWNGAWNYIRLDPGMLPAHVLKIRRKTRSERDFDYYA